MSTQIVNLSPQETSLNYAHGKTVVALCDATDGAFTVTLPDAKQVSSLLIHFIKVDTTSNAVTIDARNGQTINQFDSVVMKKYGCNAQIHSDRTNWVKLTGLRSVCIPVVDSDTAVTTGDGVSAFVVPQELHGSNVVDVIASVYSKGVTGTTDVQVRRERAGTDTDVLSTVITVGDEFYANDGVIDTDNDDLQIGDMLFVDVDAVHSGTAPNGLSVVLTFG